MTARRYTSYRLALEPLRLEQVTVSYAHACKSQCEPSVLGEHALGPTAKSMHCKLCLCTRVHVCPCVHGKHACDLGLDLDLCFDLLTEQRPPMGDCAEREVEGVPPRTYHHFLIFWY